MLQLFRFSGPTTDFYNTRYIQFSTPLLNSISPWSWKCRPVSLSRFQGLGLLPSTLLPLVTSSTPLELEAVTPRPTGPPFLSLYLRHDSSYFLLPISVWRLPPHSWSLENLFVNRHQKCRGCVGVWTRTREERLQEVDREVLVWGGTAVNSWWLRQEKSIVVKEKERT